MIAKYARAARKCIHKCIVPDPCPKLQSSVEGYRSKADSHCPLGTSCSAEQVLPETHNPDHSFCPCNVFDVQLQFHMCICPCTSFDRPWISPGCHSFWQNTSHPMVRVIPMQHECTRTHRTPESFHRLSLLSPHLHLAPWCDSHATPCLPKSILHYYAFS